MVETVVTSKVTWLVFGGLVGLCIWSLKGFISTKTARIKASDQYMTQGEIEDRCLTQHQGIEKDRKMEMNHLKELIETKFDHGAVQFTQIGERQDKTDGTVTKMSETLIRIADKVGA